MKALAADGEKLKATRPTAINLEWAVRRSLDAIGAAQGIENKLKAARRIADAIADEDAEFCRKICIGFNDREGNLSVKLQ